MNPNLIKAVIVIAALSIPTIIFLSIWIKNLRNLNSAQSLEIASLKKENEGLIEASSSMATILRKLDFALDKPHVCKLLHERITDMEEKFQKQLLSSHEISNWTQMRPIFKSAYAVAFERDFRVFSRESTIQSLCDFRTEWLDVEKYIENHPELKEKSMIILKREITNCSWYKRLRDVVVGHMKTWKPFEFWMSEITPLLQAKALDMSKRDIQTNREQLAQYFSTAWSNEKTSAVRKWFLEGVAILNRELLSEEAKADLKQKHLDTLNNALRVLKNGPNTTEVQETVLELTKVYEATYPKQQTAAKGS